MRLRVTWMLAAQVGTQCRPELPETAIPILCSVPTYKKCVYANATLIWLSSLGNFPIAAKRERSIHELYQMSLHIYVFHFRPYSLEFD